MPRGAGDGAEVGVRISVPVMGFVALMLFVVLIVSDAFDENTYKSARNVKPVQLATASDVNTEQLLAFEKILVTEKGLEKLAERTNGK